MHALLRAGRQEPNQVRPYVPAESGSLSMNG
jgi:hypothetical protein